MITVIPYSTALVPGASTFVSASGGTPPYAFSIRPGGAGGTVNPATGKYQAPASLQSDPVYMGDTVIVTDALGATGSAAIIIGTPLMLLCDILQSEMALSDTQVFLWDQKIDLPKDSNPYIAVGVLNVQAFSNNNRLDADGNSNQYANFKADVTIDILSRGTAARDRKEEIILALGSNYSRYQQDANGFYIARIPSAFTNLSEIDGAAIPYRFTITVSIMYVVSKSTVVPYYDQVSVTTDDVMVTEDGSPIVTEDGQLLSTGVMIEP